MQHGWNYQGFLSAWGGGLLSFSMPGGIEKIAGLWFARGGSAPRLTLWSEGLSKTERFAMQD